MTFKLTYSTMFSAPEELHQRFEEALARVKAGLGATLPLYLAGQDVPTRRVAERSSPIDPALRLGSWAVGGPEELERAVAPNMPLLGPAYTLPFPAIQANAMPCINIGPWGKDFHKNTERVFAPDLYERTPALIGEAIRFVFAQPNQPARFNPPDPPVPGLPGRPERPGAGSPG